MKIPIVALTLAAALTVVPVFAQEQQDTTDKAPEAPNAHEKNEKSKAVKPQSGSVKAQEAGQEKTHSKEAHDGRIPQSDQEPGIHNPESDNKAGRGEHKQTSDRDRSVQYHFKADARDKLREHYKAQSTNRNRSVTIVRQEVVPVAVQSRIEPVPTEMVSYLGPAPEGFQYGFVDGYVLVYDPATYFVVDTIDLF